MLIIFEKPIDRKPKKQTVKNFWDLEIEKTIAERDKYEFNSAHYNLLDDEIIRLYEERRKNTPKREFPTKETLTLVGVLGAAAITAAMDYRKQNIELRGQNLKKEIAYLSWQKNLDLESCDRMVFNQSEKLSR